MTEIARAQITSSAPPSAFFERWADMDTWPEWNLDTEWCRLDGPFVEGATGTLKPKGGPKVAFVVERLIPGERFVDVSRLVGARLTFDHRVTVADGRTRVAVVVTMTGPLAPIWRLVLGQGLRASVEPDLQRLGGLAELAGRPTARRPTT